MPIVADTMGATGATAQVLAAVQKAQAKAAAVKAVRPVASAPVAMSAPSSGGGLPLPLILGGAALVLGGAGWWFLRGRKK